MLSGVEQTPWWIDLGCAVVVVVLIEKNKKTKKKWDVMNFYNQKKNKGGPSSF